MFLNNRLSINYHHVSGDKLLNMFQNVLFYLRLLSGFIYEFLKGVYI